MQTIWGEQEGKGDTQRLAVAAGQAFDLYRQPRNYRCPRLSTLFRMTSRVHGREGAFCGMQNTESCQGVICRKFNLHFFSGMKGKMRNESMQNVTKTNIC